MLTADLLCRANNKPLKMPREQAWKYLRRMVSDGTIPDGGAKVPKKPLKRHYLAALRKGIRSTVSAMSAEQIKVWLDNAGIARGDTDNTQSPP